MRLKEFKLQELLDFQPKSSHKAGDGLIHGKYPFFTSSQQQKKWFNEADFKIEAIVLGTGGAPSIHHAKDFSTSTDVFILTPKDKNISAKYVYFFLRANIDLLTQGFKGAGLKHLSRTYTESIKIPLPVDTSSQPSISEQERIAAVLEEAEMLRQKSALSAAKLNELSTSLFLEMFGDSLTNPCKWPKKKLSELCTIRRGASPRPIKNYLGGTVPWIKIGDATRGDDTYIFETAEKITEEGVDGSVFLKKGAMIFANCGVSLGFARILKIDGCIHDGWLSFSDLNPSLIDEMYLLKLINNMTPYLRRIAASGTQPNLNTTIMGGLEIPLPPIAMQKEFSETIRSLDSLKALQSDSVKNIDVLLSSISSKLLAQEPGSAPAPESKELIVSPVKLFPIQQAIGATLKQGFERGEMVLDKVLYIAQEVYKVKLEIPFVAYKLGPWDITVKNAINSGASKKNQFFKRKKIGKGAVFVLGPNTNKLFETYADAAVVKDMNAAMGKLLPLIKFWKSPDIECLATVCKVVQDNKTIDEAVVVQKVSEWKPNKFTADRVLHMLKFISTQGWDKRLL